MSSKTAAELQLEFLRKLKEKKNIPAAAKREAGKIRKKRPGKGIPLSEETWAKLREQGLLTGKFKMNKALGNWAVELLLGVPSELQSFSPALKMELFGKIRAWLVSRELK